MIQNYKLTISYDGTRYSGWQSQGNTTNTIQEKIQNILSRMTNTKVDLIGAGRTDAGVHAKAMTANAHFTSAMTPIEIRDYLNKYLPSDICVTEVSIASERFHSRYNAISKTYQYTCYAGDLKPIFDRNYVYQIECYPDISAMRSAAEYLIGCHDFKSFCGNPNFKKSTLRTIHNINIHCDGPYITFTYHGDGFLQNMVRIITGTLLEVGFKKRTVQSIQDVLSAKKRSEAGFTAPACGLCLIKVDY